LRARFQAWFGESRTVFQDVSFLRCSPGTSRQSGSDIRWKYATSLGRGSSDSPAGRFRRHPISVRRLAGASFAFRGSSLSFPWVPLGNPIYRIAVIRAPLSVPPMDVGLHSIRDKSNRSSSGIVSGEERGITRVGEAIKSTLISRSD